MAVPQGSWRHVGDLSECREFPDSMKFTYAPGENLWCRVHDRLLVCVPKSEADALQYEQERRERPTRRTRTPEEIEARFEETLPRLQALHVRDARVVASQINATYDALKTLEWGSDPALRAVCALAKGGQFQKKEWKG
jgi:hypothetical protein